MWGTREWCCQSAIGCQTLRCISGKLQCGWAIHLSFGTRIDALPYSWRVAVMCGLKGEHWHKSRGFWLIFLKCQNETYPSVFRSVSLSYIFSPPPLWLSHLLPLIHTVYYCSTLWIIEPIYSKFSHRSGQRGDSIVFWVFFPNLLGYCSGVSVVFGFYWFNLEI